MIFVNWFIFVREHLITPAIFYTRGPLQTSSAITALIYTLVIAELQIVVYAGRSRECKLVSNHHVY